MKLMTLLALTLGLTSLPTFADHHDCGCSKECKSQCAKGETKDCKCEESKCDCKDGKSCKKEEAKK